MNDWNYGCLFCDAKFLKRKDAVNHTYDNHSDQPRIQEALAVKARKQELKQIPFVYDPAEKLKVFPKYYEKLKDSFFHLPKLTKRMFQFSSKLASNRLAETNCRDQVVFVAQKVLRRDAAILDIMNNRNLQIMKGTLMHLEILSHEIAHWHTRGGHNSQFYAKQKRYFDVLINKLISGELYK